MQSISRKERKGDDSDPSDHNPLKDDFKIKMKTKMEMKMKMEMKTGEKEEKWGRGERRI